MNKAVKDNGGGLTEVASALKNLGKGRLVESWRSENGDHWYRKYEDGFIEQGGKLYVSGSCSPYSYPRFNVTLPVKFSSAEYCVNVNSAKGGYQFGSAVEQNASGFVIGISSTSGNSYQYENVRWVACGY